MLDFRSIGAYAEYVAVKEHIVAKIPDRLDFQQAAAVPLAGLTAYQALHDKARIKKGDAVLIHGASGGVGSFAVQIARAAGAMVTGICSTRNVELVEKLGAHEVIDYTRHNLRKLSGSYDIIFDAVGMLQYFRIKRNLKSTGRYITTLPNQFSNVASFFLTAIGAFFGYKKKSAFITVKPNASDLESLGLLIQEGKMMPRIDRTFTLEEIQEAHDYSESGRAKGKIVIKIS
jgi:NADPH:quinone reductase-like Zn-dependent oxidoreductase